MTNPTRAAVILAAGQGTRMNSDLPKVLHPVAGRSMLAWSIAAARQAGCARIVVVTGAHAPQVGEAARALGCDTALQEPAQGTGHAVQCAEAALAGFAGDVVVLYADTPLVRAQTIERAFGALKDASVAVLGFEAAEPGAYGRLILDSAGALARIVEAKEASPEELAVRACNSGVMAAPAEALFTLLRQVTNDNAKGEYYLTDVVGLARQAGLGAAAVMGHEAEFQGANDRAQLAAVEAAFQAEARAAALADGVSLMAPDTVYFSYDTVLERDVVVEPHVVFAPGVHVEAGAQVRAFSHLEGARVRAGAQVGPYARLRPGADIGPDAKVGNFVEIKKATLAAGAKVSHLSYIGDADVGAGANIGAGTITCNYDGFDKHRTLIDAGAFIGSNSSLVAPVRVGVGAYVGSGSVITTDVPDGALAVGRARQRVLAGWAHTFATRKQAERAARDAAGQSAHSGADHTA